MKQIVRTAACGFIGAALAGGVAAQTVDAPRFSPGEAWSYTEINQYNSLPVATVLRQVTHAGDYVRIETRDTSGKLVSEARFARAGLQSGGTLSSRAAGSLDPPLQLQPFPLRPGQKWAQTVTRTDPYRRERRHVTVSGRVEGWESVKVPAGEFRALKLMRSIYLGDSDGFRGETVRTEWEWWVPELKAAARLIVWERHKEPGGEFGETIQDDHIRYELDGYRVGTDERVPRLAEEEAERPLHSPR